MYIFQPIAIHCGNETRDTMGKFAELIPYKGRTIRKVMGGGGGEGDFQLARFFFFVFCLCRNFFCR